MSKRQSTIQSFFHKLGESNKEPESDINSDDKTSSSIENNCPNSGLLKNISCNEENDLQSKNKKIKVDDSNLENDELLKTEQFDPESPKDKTTCLKQIISICNDYKGALNANIGISWFDALEREFNKPYFRKLDEFLLKVQI